MLGDRRFLIIGPEDQDHLPMFWSQTIGEWVERDDATLYGEEVWLFPPRELPIGGKGIIDIVNHHIFYASRPGRGAENS